MPSRNLEFKVMLACPSDMLSDRDAVGEALDELNRIRAKDGVSVRLAKWETDAVPGVGETGSQDVINRQLLRDYDILVALFGQRLGAPTETAASGTAEEIEHALSSPKLELGNLHLQVYFKNESINWVESDLDELKRVIDFKKTLAGKKVLYKEYSGTDDLQRQIRLNISKAIDAYLAVSVDEAKLDTKTALGENGSSDLGVIDYGESHEESLKLVTIAIGRLNYITNHMAEAVNEQAAELAKLKQTQNRSKIKAQLLKSATLFDETAAKYEVTLDDLKRGNQEAFDALRAMLTIIDEDQMVIERDEVVSLSNSNEELIDAVTGARRGLDGFRDAISKLPRVTREFNTSKRRLLSSLSAVDLLLEANLRERRMIQMQIEKLIQKRFPPQKSLSAKR